MRERRRQSHWIHVLSRTFHGFLALVIDEEEGRSGARPDVAKERRFLAKSRDVGHAIENDGDGWPLASECISRHKVVDKSEVIPDAEVL